MRNIIDKKTADLILNAAEQASQAAIFDGSTQKPFSCRPVTFNLSTAATVGAAAVVGFPFKSFWVASATDVNVSVNFLPDASDQFDSTQTFNGGIPIKYNDTWASEYPKSKGFFTWSAQTGKSITIIFFVDSIFTPGQQVSVNGGGVSISEGSSFTTTRVDLTAATATLALASDSLLKVAQIQNNTGAEVWFGNSSVSNTGANLGIRVPAGSIFVWKNSSALYAYSVAGGSGDNGLLVMKEI